MLSFISCAGDLEELWTSILVQWAACRIPLGRAPTPQSNRRRRSTAEGVNGGGIISHACYPYMGSAHFYTKFRASQCLCPAVAISAGFPYSASGISCPRARLHQTCLHLAGCAFSVGDSGTDDIFLFMYGTLSPRPTTTFLRLSPLTALPDTEAPEYVSYIRQYTCVEMDFCTELAAPFRDDTDLYVLPCVAATSYGFGSDRDFVPFELFAARRWNGRKLRTKSGQTSCAKRWWQSSVCLFVVIQVCNTLGVPGGLVSDLLARLSQAILFQFASGSFADRSSTRQRVPREERAHIPRDVKDALVDK